MSANTHVTRASNKDTHPGMPDIDEAVLGRPKPRPKRTKAQIVAENADATEKKAAKAEEVKQNNEKRAQLMERITTLEGKMRGDEQQTEREAAHLPRSLSCPCDSCWNLVIPVESCGFRWNYLWQSPLPKLPFRGPFILVE